MSKKNIRLRKRVIRVFKDTNEARLSTAEIVDKLSQQRTADSGKRYLIQPSITKISNLLRYHNEFRRCSTDTLVKYNGGSNFKMATWELTEEGRSQL